MKVRHPLQEISLLPRHRRPFVAVVDEALPGEVCDALVARIERERPAPAPIVGPSGEVMNARVRNNERVMFDDAALAADLFARTREMIPETLHEGMLIGYNERFRGYRYKSGQRFAPHFDGAFVRDENQRSQITVLFYLNEGFSGGETILNDYETIITPRRGMALLFQHAILHEGATVTAGCKYVLRTDAMYRFTASRTRP